MDKVKGLISESDYVEMSKDFTTERDRLERVIADGEKQLAEIEEKLRWAITAVKLSNNIPTWNTLPAKSWKY